MQAIIDEQGRVEIPLALRDRLQLNPGAIVELQPVGNGLHVTASESRTGVSVQTGTLKREGSLLVLGGLGPLSVEDVNLALNAGRENRLTGEDAS